MSGDTAQLKQDKDFWMKVSLGGALGLVVLGSYYLGKSRKSDNNDQRGGDKGDKEEELEKVLVNPKQSAPQPPSVASAASPAPPLVEPKQVAEPEQVVQRPNDDELKQRLDASYEYLTVNQEFTSEERSLHRWMHSLDIVSLSPQVRMTGSQWLLQYSGIISNDAKVDEVNLKRAWDLLDCEFRSEHYARYIHLPYFVFN